MAAASGNEHIMNPHVLFGDNKWALASAEEREKMAKELEPYQPMRTSNTPPTSPGIYARLNAEPNSFAPPPTKSAGLIRASPYAAQVRAEMEASLGAAVIQNGHVAFGDFNKRLLREIHEREEAAHAAAQHAQATASTSTAPTAMEQ